MRHEGMGTSKKYEFAKQRFGEWEKARKPFETYPGSEVYVHPSAIIHWDCVTLEKGVYIGPYCIVGDHGFSYGFDEDGRPMKVAHTGRVIIREGVELTGMSTVYRGTVEDTIIGKYTMVNDFTHIAHNVHIGKNVVITGFMQIGGGCRIGDKCWLGQGCIIKTHVQIAEGNYIGAGAVVVKDIPETYGVHVGVPAKFLRERKVSVG